MLIKGMDLALPIMISVVLCVTSAEDCQSCICASFCRLLAQGFRAPNIYKTDYVQFADTNIQL